MTSSIEQKIEARLKKPFFTEMLVMAVSTGSNHTKYIEVVKEWSLFIRKKLEERNLIKNIKHRPKEFWNFKGKKKIYNIDGGQLSLAVPGGATMGVRVGTYRVKPGDYSKDTREGFDDSSTLISNLVDRTGHSHYEEDGDFDLDYKKMLEGSRMIMELAEVVKQSEAKGKWNEKPTKDDVIFLHGPIIYQAAMYHLSSSQNSKSPPYKEGFFNSLLQHSPNFQLDIFKNRNKEDEKDLRTFLPIYCELGNYIKNSNVPTYGVVERSINKSSVVQKAVIGELYQTKTREWLMLKQRDFGWSWNTKRVDGSDEGEKVLDIFKQYMLGDPNLFDLILDEGEYLEPIQVTKQYEEKYSSLDYIFRNVFKTMPEPHVTYLKTSEFRKPLRIETLNVTSNFHDDIDLVYHSAKMLPQYAFPLGLDTVDKLAKIPSWMKNSFRNAYQMQMLRSVIDSGNKEHIELGLKSLIPNRTGWNRP
jgi:hypothetical protein|tara:strand:- start:2705 stop:4123 length:1419 start_codon:yes stop_codon:yes gene_type:complete